MQPDWRREVYRASRLDEYRAYVSGELWDGSEYTAAEFVQRMTTHTESFQMAAGTAVHAVIEKAAFGPLPEHAEANGWKIHFDLEGTLSLPFMREVPLYREHNGIPLFGRCDAIDINTVHDIKTTSAIDVDRYLDSYQWRAYCWMSGRHNFVYDILKVKLDEEVKLITVQEYVPIKTSVYPQLNHDVQSLLQDFDACVRALGIAEFFQKKAA